MELEFHQMEMKYKGLRVAVPGMQARLMASLATEGQLHPLLVVASKTAGQPYVLIDGYLRVAALQKLGRDTAEAMILPLDEAGALIFRHCQENAHRRSALEDGWLLRELLDSHGMSQAELSRRLQRSESWVSKRLSLVRELPAFVHDLVRNGKLCAYLAMRYLVPFARAKKSDCEQLAQGLSGQRVSSRQMERLYAQWKCSDKEGRKRIVENPLLFLKTAQELKLAPLKQAGDDFQSLAEDLEIIDAVSNRARRRLRERKAHLPLPQTIMESWNAARSSYGALAKELEKEHAGCTNQSGDSGAQGTRA